MSIYQRAEQSALNYCDQAGIGPRQHCVREVAMLFARLALNNKTADGDGYAYPSAAAIAKMTRYTIRSVRRALATLTDNGFLRTIGRSARRAVRTVARSVTALAKGDMATPSKGDMATPNARLAPISLGKEQTNRPRPVAPVPGPTPTPPQWTRPGPAPRVDPALRERLRTGWRSFAS